MTVSEPCSAPTWYFQSIYKGRFKFPETGASKKPKAFSVAILNNSLAIFADAVVLSMKIAPFFCIFETHRLNLW